MGRVVSITADPMMMLTVIWHLPHMKDTPLKIRTFWTGEDGCQRIIVGRVLAEHTGLNKLTVEIVEISDGKTDTL